MTFIVSSEALVQVDEPNVIIPLASSYNVRGVGGFSNNFTNAIDQRKINAFYQREVNSATGNPTYYLTKRPGVTLASDSFGSSVQVAYLVHLAPDAARIGTNSYWVFSTSGNDVRASDSSTTTTIVASAGFTPRFADITRVSGTNTLVVQLSHASTAQTVWYSSAIGTFTQITDGDFTARTMRGKMEFMDGYAFIMDTTNRIYNSDVNSLANWTATNFTTKTIGQDVSVSLARLGNQILACGEWTMEVFRNAGNAAGSPLERVPHLQQNVGIVGTVLGGANIYAVHGGRMYFVGRGGGNAQNLQVYAYDGNRSEPVSSPAVSKILASTSGHYSVYHVGFLGYDAIAIGLDITTAATQRWLMFFPSLNEWFEWNSTVFTPVNHGNYHLGVGANQHRLYSLPIDSTDNWQDAGTDYQFLTQFQLPKNGAARKFMPLAGVIGDTARAALNLAVEFSDDDYQTFSTARNIDMTSQKKTLYRCGSYRDGRAVRLSYTGAREVRLEKFLARIQ